MFDQCQNTTILGVCQMTHPDDPMSLMIPRRWPIGFTNSQSSGAEVDEQGLGKALSGTGISSRRLRHTRARPRDASEKSARRYRIELLPLPTANHRRINRTSSPVYKSRSHTPLLLQAMSFKPISLKAIQRTGEDERITAHGHSIC